MPALSAAERQKQLLQAEIAKLSGAISSQTSHHASSTSSRHSSSYHPYRGSSRGRGAYNSSSYPSSYNYNPRGSSSRGRGASSSTRSRNGHSLDLRGKNSITNAAGPSASSSNAKQSGASAAPSADRVREDGEVSPSPPPATNSFAGSSSAGGPSFKGKERATASSTGNGASEAQNWVKATSKKGNMSLMTAEKRQALASRPRPPKFRKTRVPASIQVLSSTTDTSGQRVVIDGVIFEFEPGGTKLTRIGEVDPSSANAGPSKGSPNSTPTRRKVSYGGKQFRRTSRGNLISGKAVGKDRKYCRYYTRTGKCARALTCPYLHSPEHRSICPAFLRSTCPHTADTCLLSHTPSAHNTPSCLHFQATSYCKKGEDCPYPHVRTAQDAPVCAAFAEEGWCEKEPGTCGEMHIWECPEFRAKGVCSKGGKCGLRHVLRADTAGDADTGTAVYKDVSGDVDMAPVPTLAAATPGTVQPGQPQGAFDDGSTFIGFGPDDEQDHGMPQPMEDMGISADESGMETDSGEDGEDGSEDDSEVEESEDEQQDDDDVNMDDGPAGVSLEPNDATESGDSDSDMELAIQS